MGKFYITAAIPYVNAKPHVGHALEFIQADVIARYHKIIGDDTLLLSGGDENALKNVQAAEKENIPVQEFVDKNNLLFFDLTKKLNCDFGIWQKGSAKNHYIASQKLWNLCFQNGDIYEKTYKGLYCVGCELFYAKSELDKNGECFEHPGKKLEIVEEKNYFFKLSKYQSFLTEIIKNGTLKIVPEKRKHEVLSFLEKGLDDISISRTNERAKNWGVPVPNHSKQRIYVWFDALNIYQSGVGFGWDEKNYNKWWPADVHVIGKGILRFHAVYWPAFLKSAGLKLPKKIFVHEYFTVNGQKMSKTLGNVIDPSELVEKYGADPLRYYFLAKFSPFSDGDFSEGKFKEVYNADLANGLGNLVARVVALCKQKGFDPSGILQHQKEFEKEKGWLEVLPNSLITAGFLIHIETFEFNLALEEIWKEIKGLDTFINNKQPWNISHADKNNIIFIDMVKPLIKISFALRPFLPETSEKILEQFTGKIKTSPPLFPRI